MTPPHLFPPAYPVVRPVPLVLTQGFFAARRTVSPRVATPRKRRQEAPGGALLAMAWVTTIAATWFIDLAGSPTTLHFFDAMFEVERAEALNVPQLVMGTMLALVAVGLFVAARRERLRQATR